MIHSRLLRILPWLGLALLASCQSKENIMSFHPLTQFAPVEGIVSLPMDMDIQLADGLRLPSVRQVKGGKFAFRLTLRNNTGTAQALHYKVYYQNESYKFPEAMPDGLTPNPEASQNFYGSWEKASEGFRSTPVLEPGEAIEVVDSIVIWGNPRDEQKYMSPPLPHITADSGRVARAVKAIYNNPDWLAHVKAKAERERLPEEVMATRDALWVLANPPLEGAPVNQRWQRNPRVGEYSFMAVVATEEALGQVPQTVTDISLVGEDSLFVNPFWYFLHGPGAKQAGLEVSHSLVRLRTSAALNLAKGVYVPCLNHPDGLCGQAHYGSHCGDTEQAFHAAQLSQFFHHLPQGWSLKNIPVAWDVTRDDYTPEVYRSLKDKYPMEQRADSKVSVAKEACTTVWYDPAAKVLRIMTPGSPKVLKKENEGVMTRIGMTYGKWRAHVKFPDMINGHNMWTGLTHAIWLKYQSEQAWNHRKECVPGGYLIQNAPRPEDGLRQPKSHYSEIDIEIAKESAHWPRSSYERVPELYRTDDPATNRDVTVSCTNWDLGCKSGSQYISAIVPWTSPQGRPYILHRWKDWTPAMTSKQMYPHDSLFGRWAWFEIDWQPERIIWRVGPDLQHLSEVGYMDRTVTDVPDNQMIMVVSQEFHFAEWWPLAPQSQDDIPYPAAPLFTEIDQIRIDY